MIKLKDILLENDIKNAMQLAKDIHAGQTRRGTDTAYYIHPLGIYKLAKKFGLSKNEQIAALLHDTIEDAKNPAEVKKQIKEKFGNNVLELVLLLTHKRGANYNEYILKLAKKSKLALNIKLLDMHYNLNDNPSDRQKKKYPDAIKFLQNNGIKIEPKFRKLFEK